MEFWGVEVKVGQLVPVELGFENIIHLSQACLAKVSKDDEKDPIYLYVNTENQKLCLGMLSGDKFPQIGFDLVFDKRFELSHTSKSGSVHFCGYKTNISDYMSEDMECSARNSLKEATKGSVATAQQNKEILEPSKQLNDDIDDNSDSVDSSDVDETPKAKKASSDEDGSDDENESDNSDEDGSGKEAQNKERQISKRQVESSVLVPVPAKKAKLVTPQKIDAKKCGGHVATPYPLKQVAKTFGNSDNSKQQSQITGVFRCNPCNRTFGSGNALQSHTKAKHGPK